MEVVFGGGLAFDVGVEVIYKIYIYPELSLLSSLFREWNIYKVYIYIQELNVSLRKA